MTKRWHICDDCGTHHTSGKSCPECNQLRGNPVYEIDGEWFYYKTDEPTAGNPLPCGYCGKSNTTEGYDGCIGHLPNVMNACCGHGRTVDAYVQFTNDNCIRGKEAVDYFKT